MRKVFLEQNLGKKTKCRFTRKNPKELEIKLVVEAQKAVSTPSLTQPLVISGVSVIEFCDRFNQETSNLEPGLLIRSKTRVNQASKTFDLQLITPSVFQLMKRILNVILGKKPQVYCQIIHNIALIKLITQLGNHYYLTDLLGILKQVAGNLRSFEDLRLLRNKLRKKKWQLIDN